MNKENAQKLINDIDNITYLNNQDIKDAFELVGFDAVEHYIKRLQNTLEELDLIKLYNEYINN